MPEARPTISVCIPAFNRAKVLDELLESILNQDFSDFELLIIEDKSPERLAIRDIVSARSAQHPGVIRYVENGQNLGYDGNLRALTLQARGRFCLFMGNDDLMCPGALRVIASAIERHSSVGVIVRTYASFDGT